MLGAFPELPFTARRADPVQHEQGADEERGSVWANAPDVGCANENFSGKVWVRGSSITPRALLWNFFLALGKRMSRSRGWCFTINNYTQSDVEQIDSFSCRYMVYGFETGACGTPHIQGFLYMENDKTLQVMKKKFHPTAHLEPQRGTSVQASDYCKKDGKVVERGVLPRQGRRTDLFTLKDEIVAGKRVDDIVMESPEMYHQYGRTLHKIEDLCMRRKFRTAMTQGIWIYGSTGTGKSTLGFSGYTPDTHYRYVYSQGGNEWQDGYTQQDTVIYDEYRGQLPMHVLLTTIDEHPNHSYLRRGREPLPFISKRVIITSSMHPREVYKNLDANDNLNQLLRRLKIFRLEPGVPPPAELINLLKNKI